MPRRVTPKLYFHWLCNQIHISDDCSRYELFSELHQKQFAWSVPNDDNRIVDAMLLRHEFFTDLNTVATDEPVVSVLEVIISLAKRVAFDNDDRPDRWAWILIDNLTLGRNRFLDPIYPPERDEISDILDRLIWRQYKPSGLGGFFPLAHPTEDQTKVEIWYQMSAYLEERHPEYD